MRNAFACGLALSALGLVSPAFAGTVYVPIQDPAGSDGSTHSTEVWVSNSGTDNRPVASTFLAAGTNGTQRAGNPAQTVQVVAGRTLLLQGLGAAGKTGLLEVVDTSARMMVEARLKSTALDGAVTMTAVPVISSGNAIQPNQPAHMLGLRRDAARGERTDFVLVNLAKEGTALCNVGFYRSNGTRVGSDTTLSVPALSSLYFADAFGLLNEPNVSDARAQVSCNRQFFTYAPVFYPASSQYVFVTPSASGASTLGGGSSSGGGGGTTTTAGAVVFERNGLIHVPTTSNPKGIVDITVPRTMSLRRMVVDLDFIPGPWNRLKDPANHAIIWIHRNIGQNEFRSNSAVNVNAFTNKIKMNQNVDLPGGNQTVAEKGVSWVQGQLYHLRYTYDAENQSITATLTANGVQVATMGMVATANSRALRVEPGKLRTEFGHYDFQHGPELASYGWQYMNLKVEMVPYD